MSVEYDESFIKSLPITDICAIMNELRLEIQYANKLFDGGVNSEYHMAIVRILKTEFNRRLENTFIR